MRKTAKKGAALSADAVPAKKSFLQRNRKEIVAYALLAFPLIWFTIFFVVGFVRGFIYSLTDYDLRFSELRGINFNNFKNYIDLFTDSRVWNGLKVSVIWTAVMLVGNNVLGLLMAVLINSLHRGKGGFLAALYWPTLVSAAVSTQITLYFFRPTADGVMNIVIGLFGHEPIAWLETEDTALLSLMLQPFFLGFSMKMMIYYAGIKGIPRLYYESASLETNSRWHLFWYITLPLLAPVLFLNVILSVIDGLKVLAPMQLITPDNPYTESLVYYLYGEAFTKTKIGYASAIAFFLFAIIMLLTILQNFAKKKEVSYE